MIFVPMNKVEKARQIMLENGSDIEVIVDQSNEIAWIPCAVERSNANVAALFTAKVLFSEYNR